MAETKLIIIRHGETEWNTINRYQGQLDSPLTARGIAQADAIGKRMAVETFDALYSSDLPRAIDTAKHILNHHSHLELRTDPSLRERDFGKLQGLTREEGLDQQPEIEANYRQGDPHYRIPDGESLHDVYHRSIQGLNQIANHHPGQTVTIVTHGGVLGMCIRHTIGLTLEQPRRYRFFNASYNEFFVDNNNWVLGTWGDISHLKDIGSDDDF